ncbi:F-box protein At2g02240-like [Rosa rugosa]|uniref:F-box protein At2g02240-like n=1 Tax=Rosa rugosa TaxID=74645 RepID=UPI002B4137CA|nr:F-box protein At2g02240-like [Rosa rugosa]
MDLQQLPVKFIANAAESDAVWDTFLPPEIHTILSQSGESGLLAARSKKELYLALCNKPLLIDDGKLSFSLDEWSGRKCYMISARELGIVWGEDPQYWTWTSHPESRFQEVAELLHVGWLEIHGKLDTRLLSPSTLYKAYLVVKFTRNAFGFKHLPGEVSVGLEGGEHTKQTLFLHIEGEINPYYEREMGYSKERGDAEGETVREVVINDNRYQRESPEWLEIELGEFFCDGGEDGLLKMRYVAKGSLYWKSGLIVQGIEVRPKRQ